MNESSSPIPPVSVPPIATAQKAPDANQLMRFENEKKSAGVALFLCWVLGIFGAHRFYLGRPHGATMLIISLISFLLCLVLVGFVGIIAMWIWMIIDLFSVSRWAKEYNAALLARIQAGQA